MGDDRTGFLDEQRRRLEDERRRLVDRAEGLEAEAADELQDPGDLALEGGAAPNGTPAGDREWCLGLARAERDRVASVERALGAIARGSYGICARCGAPIGDERLRAEPDAAFCRPCQAVVEADEPIRLPR